MSERVKKPIRTAEEWFQFERQAREQGFTTVCGVDEAGRGPLAGPVYAAAVILPPGLVIEGVNDSKKLSEKKREALFPIICEQALAFGIGYATEEEIDTYNILQATYMAMRRAVEALPVRPQRLLIDGNRLPQGLDIPAEAIVKGDALSASIAAASILAKVSRDRVMIEYDGRYPAYGFAKHKGYGTAEHIEALRKWGPCPIHRGSFLARILSAG